MCTFASKGGGVNSFPLAINMAFILAAIAAAISTPPGGAGLSPGCVGWDTELFEPAVLTTPGKETGWPALSLLLCLGWAV